MNPGHSLRSRSSDPLTRHRKSERLRNALDALEGALQLGWNSKKGGGITYMKDILTKPLLDTTVMWSCSLVLFSLICVCIAIDVTNERDKAGVDTNTARSCMEEKEVKMVGYLRPDDRQSYQGW